MDSILEAINEWMQTLLIDGIMGNVEGMFDTINAEVSSVASQVGMTPSAWNSGVFSLIQNLSNSVIMPIAGLILTFVMTYELIQMIIDRNNLNDFPPSDIFKWIMKTFIAVTIVTNTFPIVMGIFDVSQSVVNSAAGVIITDTSVSVDNLDTFRTSLEAMNIGALLGLYLQSFLIGFCMNILTICIFIIVYGRMIEIYLMTSLAPIPLATMTCKEWNIGQNYIKSMLALAFQAFLIMVCIGIYAVLVQSIVISGEPFAAIWTCVGYTVLLCFALFKTGTLSKTIFSAH
ncbi:MAG: CD0415/CD1112 family protein [Eubacteriales bacterium]